MLSPASTEAPIRRHRLRIVAVFGALLAVGLGSGPGLAQDSVDARVETLEAEIAELKAMVGTLESLVRATPSLPPDKEGSVRASPRADDLESRIGALETQIGALTNQIELIGRQMSRLEAGLDAAPDAMTSAPQPQNSAPVPEPTAEPAPAPAVPEEAAENADPRARWYGPRPGEAEEDDGRPRSIMPPNAAPGDASDDMPQSLAALPDENAQVLYEQGYGDFLQQDYAAAETAFSKLMKEYPDDPLAGSAKYWLGETYYVREQYKEAADTFLAAYREHSSSDKAPDSLLKLGMSLAALGQTDAACSTFVELNDKFPDAPGHLLSQAEGEATKAGC